MNRKHTQPPRGVKPSGGGPFYLNGSDRRQFRADKPHSNVAAHRRWSVQKRFA